MKRKILGLTAITVALSLTAFTLRPNDKSNASYFWFPLDPSTGFPDGVTTLVYQSNDPFECGNFPTQTYCSGAYTSYTGSSPYFASGFTVVVDHNYP